MKNLILTAVAVLAFGQAFAQTNPKTKDSLVTGKKVDTTISNRDKKNTVKEAVKTKDHTKVTRQKVTTKDTVTTKNKTKPATR